MFLKKTSLGIALFCLVLCSSAYCEDLELAAYNGEKQKVIDILKTKPNPDHRDSFGGTALHGAMFQKDVSIITLLLDYGFDPNAKGTQNGYTPLHDAVWASNHDAVKVLLERGSNPGIKNKDGLTAYQFALESKKSQIAEYIKKFAEKKGIKYE
jgi:ankyrin repeat protein